MQIAEQIVTQTVAAATKATQSNIKLLKIYLSKNGNDRPNTNKKNK